MNMETFFTIFSFLIGLALGSFANVCIYRLPRNISIISPPSFCPKCENRIKWYHNIPVLSYILLRGRCHYCGEKISPLYPAVELTLGLISILLYRKFNISYKYIIYLIFSTGMVITFFVDLFFYIIPNLISLGGILFWVLTMLLKPFINLSDALYGALLGGGLFGTIYITYYLFTRRVGLGEGDIKLMTMAGLFIGWKNTLGVIFLASLTGALAGIIYTKLKGKDMKNPIPFGPFLSFWIVFSVIYGETIQKMLGMWNL